MHKGSVKLRRSFMDIKGTVTVAGEGPRTTTLNLELGTAGVIRSDRDPLKVVDFDLGEGRIATVDMHQDHLERV